MTEEQRLDLSSLDPRVDAARWSTFVQGTAERVQVVLARRSVDPLTLIAGWMRSVTTTVAVLVALLVPVELMLERSETGREQVDRLVQLSAESIRDGGALSATELARAVDGGAAR
jgi:hypothetical protein